MEKDDYDYILFNATARAHTAFERLNESMKDNLAGDVDSSREKFERAGEEIIFLAEHFSTDKWPQEDYLTDYERLK